MKRTILRFALLGLGVLACVLGTRAGQNSGQAKLDNVLSMMDNAAKGFHSLSANIEHVKYTAIVKDTAIESGQLYVKRDHHDEKLRIDFQKPDPRTILRTGDSLYIYTPKINRVEEYNLGKNREMAEQYLALGFGTKSENLRKNYTISLAGEETLDQTKTVILELAPKSEKMRSQITKIHIWIDENSWLPLQQKFFEAGSGDYFLSHYTNIRENLDLGNSRFKPNWPKDLKVEKPRG